MRPDGLTDEEGKVMDHLREAAKAFGVLERQHPDEARDFCDGIHRCQYVMSVRACRRAFSGWPAYRGGCV